MVGFRLTKIVKVRFFVVDSIKFRKFAAELAFGTWPMASGSFLIDVNFSFSNQTASRQKPLARSQSNL
jgi:hypothetical protein